MKSLFKLFCEYLSYLLAFSKELACSWFMVVRNPQNVGHSVACSRVNLDFRGVHIRSHIWILIASPSDTPSVFLERPLIDKDVPYGIRKALLYRQFQALDEETESAKACADNYYRSTTRIVGNVLCQHGPALRLLERERMG